MLIYAGTKSDFMADTENDCLETKLYENIKEKMNRSTGLSELNSWRNSLKEMYITLNDSAIPKDAGVAIEYNIPQTSKRVDFLISGYGNNGKGNVVIIELKQWETSGMTSRPDIVTAYTGGAERSVCHPSYQAYSYAKIIATPCSRFLCEVLLFLQRMELFLHVDLIYRCQNDILHHFFKVIYKTFI